MDFDLAPREFLVKSGFNEDLLEIRKELDSIDGELGHLHSEMNEMWSDVSGNGIGQVRLETTDLGGVGKELSCAWQFRLVGKHFYLPDSKLLTPSSITLL